MEEAKPVTSAEHQDEIRNADWTKTTWDVWKPDFSGKADALADVRLALGYAGVPEPEWHTVLLHLVQLPFWQAAPRSLQDEARQFLSAAGSTD
jgi:hypothetical protein